MYSHLMNTQVFYNKKPWKRTLLNKLKIKRQRKGSGKELNVLLIPLVKKKNSKVNWDVCKTTFNLTWSIIAIWKVKYKFHQNFVTCLQVHPLMYRSVNLGFTLERQEEVRARAKTRMQTKINVVTSSQHINME